MAYRHHPGRHLRRRGRALRHPHQPLRPSPPARRRALDRRPQILDLQVRVDPRRHLRADVPKDPLRNRQGHPPPHHAGRRRVPQGVDVHEPPRRVSPGDPRALQDRRKIRRAPVVAASHASPSGATNTRSPGWTSRRRTRWWTGRRASSSSTSSSRRGMDRWRLVLVVFARRVRARFSSFRSAQVAFVKIRGAVQTSDRLLARGTKASAEGKVWDAGSLCQETT
jgi:hypothetical protein